jgi:hypothetical protein
MRLSWFCACIIVALDCVGKATGDVPQTLFASDNHALWWIPFGFWTLAGISVWTSD